MSFMENGIKKVELLAPAGNVDGFYGAIHGGADAVYLAGDKFGARAYAENFTTEALLECIHYGHLMGRKLYLTVNTLLKDCELNALFDYLAPFYEAGMDAVIVQDLGVLRFIREHFPDWKLHVSTQMTLCSGYGSTLLKEMGACRIVPARELSLRELVAMKQQAGIEIETFIHGAMCYCYSGQCLFSSIIGGRSGNRGRCAQPCRLSYTAIAGSTKCEECYPLSLKDMCTIEHIPQLIEAGIDSFKIEGRMKKPEYAAGVTSVYRRYIDKYYELRQEMGAEEAANAYHIEDEDWKVLKSLYIRSDVQDGYYFKHNGREMVTMESPSYRGSDDLLLEDIRKKYIDHIPKLPVRMIAVLQAGQPAELTIQWGKIQVHSTGSMVEQAQKQPITEDNVRKQLSKLGDSAFYVGEISISMGENVFYPLKQINELRRMAVHQLEEQILIGRGYGRRNRRVLNEKGPEEPLMADENSGKRNGWVLSVCTKSQLETILDWLAVCDDGVKRKGIRIYVDGDLIVEDGSAVISLCQKLPACYTLYAVLPYIIREADARYLEVLYEKVVKSNVFHGFLARSMDGLGFIHQKGKALSCRVDAGVYVWNVSAGREISSLSEGFCLPYELKASEQRRLLHSLGLPCEKIVYSRIPMMIAANCLYQTMGLCKKNRGNLKGQMKSSPVSLNDKSLRDGQSKSSGKDREEDYGILKDKYRMEFPVKINCLHCMNVIYNSVPFSLYSEIPKWKECVDLRMDFTLETAEEVKRLLDAFLSGAPLPQGKYTATTGHEKRGVE